MPRRRFDDSDRINQARILDFFRRDQTDHGPANVVELPFKRLSRFVIVYHYVWHRSRRLGNDRRDEEIFLCWGSSCRRFRFKKTATAVAVQVMLVLSNPSRRSSRTAASRIAARFPVRLSVLCSHVEAKTESLGKLFPAGASAYAVQFTPDHVRSYQTEPP